MPSNSLQLWASPEVRSPSTLSPRPPITGIMCGHLRRRIADIRAVMCGLGVTELLVVQFRDTTFHVLCLLDSQPLREFVGYRARMDGESIHRHRISQPDSKPGAARSM